MTRRERLEARAAKREQWAGSREVKAAGAFLASDMREDVSGIPLGQPIIVGTSSGRKHRRAIDKAHAAMGRCIEHADKAREHAAAASTIRARLESSIFSDDANAIEALEAKAAKLDAQAERNGRINQTWRRSLKNNRGDIDATAVDVCALYGFGDATRDAMAAQARRFSCHLRSGPTTSTHERAEARRCRKRIEEIRRRTEIAARAESAGGVTITGGELVAVSFAERPERWTIDALKAAGFRWGAPSWYGRRDALPADVVALVADGGDLGPTRRAHEIDASKIAALAEDLRAADGRNPAVELRGGHPGGALEWSGLLADFIDARPDAGQWGCDTWQAIAALSRGPAAVYLDGCGAPLVVLQRAEVAP